jgi:hypothetical protein
MKYSFQDMRLVIFKEVGKTLNMIQTTLPTFFEPNSEEVCQPITEFTRKGKTKQWYCFCNKRARRCANPVCKEYGLKHGINVGGELCVHGRHNYTCKDCKGASICEHNNRRQTCKDCGGSSICQHNKTRSTCRLCNGGSFCKHGIIRSRCAECGGGGLCVHLKRREFCTVCLDVRYFCKEHKKRRTRCPICNPVGHAIEIRRTRRYSTTKVKNPTGTLEDLCITGEEWVKYLHKTFEDNYGRPKTHDDEVQIDEIIPCSAWNLPDDNKYCWHYLNSQWLLHNENQEKGSSYTEEDKLAMIERIDDYFRSASAV